MAFDSLPAMFQKTKQISVKEHFITVRRVYRRIVCCALGRHFTGIWVHRKILAITTSRMSKSGILT